MPRSTSKPAHVSTDNIFEDLGFSPDEAAVLRMKTAMHMEIMRVIEQHGYSRRDLERVLDVPQPRVSELMSGKISKMTADKLAKYLHRLGRQVEVTTSQIASC
jgi:predicted XRE-type DNA-binding protein